MLTSSCSNTEKSQSLPFEQNESCKMLKSRVRSTRMVAPKMSKSRFSKNTATGRRIKTLLPNKNGDRKYVKQHVSQKNGDQTYVKNTFSQKRCDREIC